MQTNFTAEQLADPDMRASERVLRTCVHCGRPIGAGPMGRGPQLLPGAPEEAELPGPLSARKLGGMSLWVLLALGAALSRFCAGG